jgi:hypothetical protein
MCDIVTIAALPWDGARAGKCLNNVKEMIRRHGGELCFGWALTDFGPHRCSGRRNPPALYRRWLNHVVWRDNIGSLWEVTPNAIIDDHSQPSFEPTEFAIDVNATFEILSDQEWYTRPSRYIAVRPEGLAVTTLLAKAQVASNELRNHYLCEALFAIGQAGFEPREWKVEFAGERLGSIWLLAE